MIELDERIISGKKPLTCFDIEQARGFVGKECIFSDFCLNYLDIEKFNIDNDNEQTGILSIDDNSSDYIFINAKNKNRYRFILPCEWVKPKEPEKRYRPFSLEEFLYIFGMGDRIDFKKKNDDEVKCAMFTGYITDDERIDVKTPGAVELMLGCFHYSLFSLFEDFELSFDGKWQPFGVIDE